MDTSIHLLYESVVMEVEIPDHYVIGIEEFDRQHLKIITLLNEMKHNPDNIIDKLEQLKNEWLLHCTSESEWMYKVQFPYQKNHEDAHDFITYSISQLRTKLEKRMYPDIHTPLNKLQNMIYHHIYNYDLQYVGFLQLYERETKETPK